MTNFTGQQVLNVHHLRNNESKSRCLKDEL